MASSRPRRGRIFPHERDTDDVPLIGENIDVPVHLIEAVLETQQHDLGEGTKRDYRNRLKTIYSFWKEHIPDYYAEGVVELSAEEIADKNFYAHENKHDLIYSGLNVKHFIAFLGHVKRKENGKMMSFSGIRKFNDAILFGAKKAKQKLPPSYYYAIGEFLVGYKKETANARQDGQVDEKECDPISWTLFRLILQWALDAGNVFVWVFSLLQWHCMARSVNISTLGLHNIGCGKDHLLVKYDKTKKDQAGENVHDKHCFDNPNDPLVSLFLALGVHFCLESAALAESDLLFQSSKEKSKTASSRYCSQLAELFQ